MSGAARLNTTCETTVSLPEDSDEQQEVIEVQILPQVIHPSNNPVFNTSTYPSIHPLIHLANHPSNPLVNTSIPPSIHLLVNISTDPNTDQWLMYIIAQDENWGETTTAVTNVSELDYAMEDLSKWQIDNQRSFQFRCSHLHRLHYTTSNHNFLILLRCSQYL